jgi:hypothetical protein
MRSQRWCIVNPDAVRRRRHLASSPGLLRRSGRTRKLFANGRAGGKFQEIVSKHITAVDNAMTAA